jgi:methylmalonyl-CoA mutase cobalamin-binding subunit
LPAPSQAPDEHSRRATFVKNALRAKPAAQAPEVSRAGRGGKKAEVIAMLRRKNGATLSQIVRTMGWQKHTVRGFMAGAMKKAGHTVESFKPAGGERTCRLK